MSDKTLQTLYNKTKLGVRAVSGLHRARHPEPTPRTERVIATPHLFHTSHIMHKLGHNFVCFSQLPFHLLCVP